MQQRKRALLALAVVLALVVVAVVLHQAKGQDEPALSEVEGSPLSWQSIHQGLESHATILALAVDPAAPQTIYAGAYHETGLYKSTDGGQHWHAMDRGMEGRAVYALLVVPERLPGGPAVYAGTVDGLYRSTDEGLSWQPVKTLPPVAIYALAVDQTGALYCGSEGHGLFRSDDGGNSFQRLPLGGPVATPTVLALDVSPDGEVVLVGTDGWGVYGSRDGGQSWWRALKTEFISELALSPFDDQVAYARTRKGLYRTEDGGHTWMLSSRGIDGRIDALALDTQRPGALYVGVSGSGVYRSEDGGRGWQRTGPGIRGWVGILALAVVAGPQPVLYAGAWDGVYRSDDGGEHWQRLTRGLGDVNVRALAIDPQAPDILYAADIDGLHRSVDGGESWQRLEPGPGDKGYLSLAFAPSDPQIAYAGTEGGGIARSTDGGQSWEVVKSELKATIPALVVDPMDPQRLLIRAAYERVYESSDGGQHWQARWEGLDLSTEIISLAIAPHDPRTAYAGADDGLYVSRDGCGSWQRVPSVLDRQTVYCFLFDPADSQQLYVGATEGVFQSDDGGVTWHRWGVGLEGITVITLAFDPMDRRVAYAGTKYHGLYRSDDGGRTWRSTGLDGLSINALLVHPTGQQVYVATTHGLYRGKSTNPQISKAVNRKSANQPFRHPLSAIRNQRSVIGDPLACGVHTLRADAEALAWVQETGCRWIVQLFSWREIAYWRGRYNWEFPDAVVRGAEHYGLRLAVRLDHPPDWALSPTADGPPVDLADYGDFVEAVARRYRGRVAAYIVWNEPNLAREWGGRRPDPATYVALLEEAYTRIKAADASAGLSTSPEALVVTAGLAPTNDVNDQAMDDRLFLRGMYAAGAGDYFDVLGAHPYGFAYPPDDPHGAHDGLNFARLLDLRQIMVENGDAHKPIWATEVGWTTEAQGERAWHQVTPEEQADYLVAAFEKVRREWPWLKMVAVWNLGDGLRGDEGEEEKWGYRLLDPGGRPRPAYEALAAMPKGCFFPSPTRLVRKSWQTLDIWLGRQRAEVLADDVVIHLGDNEFSWPWVPLYQGPERRAVWPDQFERWEEEKTHGWEVTPAPSTVWRGQFYLRRPGSGNWTLHLELMQNNERGNHLTVNGHRVGPLCFPVEDFSRGWVALTFAVPASILRPGPNEMAIFISKQIPDYRQIGMWEDFQFKDIWLEQP